MHGLIAFVIAVNDQIEDVAALGRQGDELLAGRPGIAIVINQCEIAFIVIPEALR